MLDFADIQKVIGVFREESKTFMSTLLNGCMEIIGPRFMPLELNIRTHHIALETMRELLIEKKVLTQEEFDAKFKDMDYNFAVKEKEMREKLEAQQSRIARPTELQKKKILGN